MGQEDAKLNGAISHDTFNATTGNISPAAHSRRALNAASTRQQSKNAMGKITMETRAKKGRLLYQFSSQLPN